MLETKIITLTTFISKFGPLIWDQDVLNAPSSLEEEIKKIGIRYDPYGDLLQLDLKVFFGDVRVVYTDNLSASLGNKLSENKTILFIYKEGTCFEYDSENKLLTQYGVNNPHWHLKISNLLSYQKLFSFISSNKFCDYFNDANKEIIFYSSINGIFKIKFDAIAKLHEDNKIEKRIDEFIESSSSIEIKPYVKNSIFSHITQGTSIHIDEIIDKIESILETTNRDYDLMSKKFDFDKFRDSLYKEKEKYFTSIREIIGKIFGQAIGIPISITATVFSSYKVEQNTILLILIGSSFLTYTIFYIKIQLIYSSDLKEILQDFKRDFALISNNSGLSSNLISVEKEKIEKRIQKTLATTYFLIATISLLGALVIIYILYQIPIIYLGLLIKWKSLIN